MRIILGIFLCYKGNDFLRNTSLLISLISGECIRWLFPHRIISPCNTFCAYSWGPAFNNGYLTRFACLIQIPVLIGAVIFVKAAKHVLIPYAESYVTIAVLLALFYCLIAGNGPLCLKISEEEKKKGH